MPPEPVFFMIQSGWPADNVLFAAVASLNGLKNQETSLDGVTPPDADFLRAIELLRNIQRSGAVSLRVKQDAQKLNTTILTFRAKDVPPTTLAELNELRNLLRLDPEATEFTLVFGGIASHEKEVAVLTRSILHVMSSMAAQVEVPPEDIQQGRAVPGLKAGDTSTNLRSLVRIRCSESKPKDASVAVYYRGHWFWIDDRDLPSKRAFAFMIMLFTLSETGDKQSLPLITIPAQ